MPKMPKVIVAKVAPTVKTEKPGAGSTVSKPKSSNPISRLGDYAHPPKKKK